MSFTRGMAEEMKKMMEALMAQIEEMKAEMKTEMKAGQEEMKASQEEIKAGQVEMKAEIKSVQDELKEKIEAGQNEMKAIQDELKEQIEAGQEEMKTKIDSIEHRIQEVKDGVQGEIREVKEEMQDQIEELKVDVGQISKVMNENEGKFEKIEEKFEMMTKEMKNMEEKMRKEVDIVRRNPIATAVNNEDFQLFPATSHTTIKPNTYDGKTSWTVYKMQFQIVAEANNWDAKTKACQLAASLRDDAADILRILPENDKFDFDALSNALELRFGEKGMRDYCRIQLKTRQQKASETLQELATDIERLSIQAYPDCPSQMREELCLTHFIDGVRDLEIQRALRLGDFKDLKSALVYAIRVESAQQATRRDRHHIRAARVPEGSNEEFESLKEELLNELRREMRGQKSNAFGRRPLKCWNCGSEGHLRRNCQFQVQGSAPKVTEQGN